MISNRAQASLSFSAILVVGQGVGGEGERPILAPGVLWCCHYHFVYDFYGLLLHLKPPKLSSFFYGDIMT